jgi:outer membrane lipase/esterase
MRTCASLRKERLPVAVEHYFNPYNLEEDTMRQVPAAMLGLLMAGGVAASPVPDELTALIVTGDSNSDPGNFFELTTSVPALGFVGPEIPLPPSDDIPRYYSGQYSNGPVWAELVGDAFEAVDKPVVNWAYGVSGAIEDNSSPLESLVPDLDQQIDLASSQLPVLGLRPQFVVFTGSNDLIRFVEDDGPPPEEAAEAVIEGLVKIAALGIRDVIVATAPDLGRIPRFALFQPDLVAAASDAASRFNNTLLAGLSTLDPQGVNVETFRIDRLFDGFFDDPARYGITETSMPCIVPAPALPGLAPFYTPINPSPPPTSICSDPNVVGFFDASHVSATLHQALAVEFIGLLDDEPAPIPISGTLPLVGVGIACLFVIRRRSA